ncbi:Hok/Gef family protein [Cronobacter dublinensis]|nr:Hok/Gef family protein [Cronobacter dublinensis]
MAMKDNTFIWCVIIVCLTVLMFTTLSRETLCELRLRGASMEVVASLACKFRE